MGLKENIPYLIFSFLIKEYKYNPEKSGFQFLLVVNRRLTNESE